jgi:hypothetical protein
MSHGSKGKSINSANPFLFPINQSVNCESWGRFTQLSRPRTNLENHGSSYFALYSQYSLRVIGRLCPHMLDSSFPVAS